MLLGLLSDTHDDVHATRRALAWFREADVDHVLHLGDVTSPATLELFDGLRLHVVRGNMDHDAAGIRRAAEALDPAASFDDVHDLVLGDRRVGMIHGHDHPRLAGMVQSGAFDLVLHGHTHVFRDERAGPTRIVNPGAVHGPRDGTPSVCLYDPEADALERVLL